MQTLAEIMTRDVVTVSDEATLREAAAILTERQISGAPVVNSEGALVGILSESDLLNEVKKREALPRVTAFGLFIAPEATVRRLYHEGADLAVRTVMTTSVISASEEMSVQEASRLLLNKKINRLPVVNTEGALVGIVTREDILKAVFALS